MNNIQRFASMSGVMAMVETGPYVAIEDYDTLQAELTAERERRVAAEKIIQYAEEHMSPSFMACEADAYRKRFNVVSWPKGDDHG